MSILGCGVVSWRHGFSDSQLSSPTAPEALVDLARAPAWEDSLVDTPQSAIEGRLCEADALRDGSDTDRGLALAAYRILHESLRPERSTDCDRVEWVLDTLTRCDDRFGPLLRRAGQCAARTVVRLRSNVALGAFLEGAGEFAEAETLFLGVLKEARGEGSVPERGACLNLCRLYGQQRRVFESFVIARHAVTLFRDAADPTRELYSLIEVIRCLADMREWDAFDAVLVRIDALIADPSVPARTATLPGLFLARLRSAVERDTPHIALKMLDEMPPASTGQRFSVDRPAGRQSLRGAVLTELGRLHEAADLLARTRSLVEPYSSSWYTLLDRQATCAALRGDDACLRDVGADALLLSNDELIQRLGSGRGLRIGISLEKALRSRGFDAVACRALDLAAACAIARIREIDRVVRDLPELSLVTVDDRALLTRVRRRFIDEHRELLCALEQTFERAEAASEPWLETLRSGAHAVVCAWCARLRSADGHWMPVGHYVPREGPLPLTHGICEPCLEQLYDRA